MLSSSAPGAAASTPPYKSPNFHSVIKWPPVIRHVVGATPKNSCKAGRTGSTSEAGLRRRKALNIGMSLRVRPQRLRSPRRTPVRSSPQRDGRNKAVGRMPECCRPVRRSALRSSIGIRRVFLASSSPISRPPLIAAPRQRPFQVRETLRTPMASSLVIDLNIFLLRGHIRVKFLETAQRIGSGPA